MKSNSRHRARRLALQGLCCLDVQGERAAKQVYAFVQDSEEEPATLGMARDLLRDSLAARQECDGLLKRHARHWDLGRLALVDRNILRLAVHELRQRELSHKIIISEALRLAQEFSTAESPRFINGVLDAIAKELASQEK